MKQELGFQIDLAADGYLTVLARLHSVLQPESYLEIGTRTGDSFKLARCASIAIDPAFNISNDVIGSKPSALFYQMTSDRFFQRHRVSDLGCDAIDFAYLDGMHLAEFLLRDFCNVEHVCKRNSIVVIHDCIPGDVYMTCRHESDAIRSRSSHPDWWTGDVWKTIWALKKYRPDLTIVALNSPPSGLICVTNFDPASHTLEKNYAAIVREMASLPDTNEFLQQYLADLAPVTPTRFTTFEQLSEIFWL